MPRRAEDLWPPEVKRVVESVVDGPGETPRELRRTVEERAARRGGAKKEDLGLPKDLERYVTKVALYAYKVTDEDVEELKASGYSENALYEITVAAALGAGLARLERGLWALEGGEDAAWDS